MHGRMIINERWDLLLVQTHTGGCDLARPGCDLVCCQPGHLTSAADRPGIRGKRDATRGGGGPCKVRELGSGRRRLESVGR